MLVTLLQTREQREGREFSKLRYQWKNMRSVEVVKAMDKERKVQFVRTKDHDICDYCCSREV